MSGIFPNPGDMLTLKPFIRQMEERLTLRFKRIVADAGYESEENLKFLEDEGKEAYIKPADYEQRGTKKRAAEIVHRDNMEYDAQEDCCTTAAIVTDVLTGKKLSQNAEPDSPFQPQRPKVLRFWDINSALKKMT